MKQASLKDGKKSKPPFEGGVWVSLVFGVRWADCICMSAHYCTIRRLPAFPLVLVFMDALLSSLIWLSRFSPPSAG